MRGFLCSLKSCVNPYSPWCGHTDSGGTILIENLDSPVTSSDEEGELSVDDLDTSLYIPTPTKLRRVCVKVPIPDKMCFLELKQLESFVELLNSVRRCVTPGCSGALVPSAIKSIGLGGAISITFSCNHCSTHHIPFESFVKCGGCRRCTGGLSCCWLYSPHILQSSKTGFGN